jgi:hypothetical protein
MIINDIEDSNVKKKDLLDDFLDCVPRILKSKWIMDSLEKSDGNNIPTKIRKCHNSYAHSSLTGLWMRNMTVLHTQSCLFTL